MDQIETFLKAVESADFITVDQETFLDQTAWETAAIDGKPDNQIFRISWAGGENATILTEEGVQKGVWNHNTFICDDHEGDEVTLGFFSVEPLINPDQSLYIIAGLQEGETEPNLFWSRRFRPSGSGWTTHMNAATHWKKEHIVMFREKTGGATGSFLDHMRAVSTNLGGVPVKITSLMLVKLSPSLITLDQL